MRPSIHWELLPNWPPPETEFQWHIHDTTPLKEPTPEPVEATHFTGDDRESAPRDQRLQLSFQETDITLGQIIISIVVAVIIIALIITQQLLVS